MVRHLENNVMHASAQLIDLDRASSARDSLAQASLSAAAATDDGLSAFLCARPRLFGIASRMVGCAAEAEDIVQDVWLRWQATDRSPVRNPLAFLVTATTRLAINVLRSARARREIAVGPSLPEPVDVQADPALGAERGEALARAVRRLLETLSPIERAVYVLRESFNYPYREIAQLLRIEEPHARQLVSRARERLTSGRRAAVRLDQERRLFEAFVAAATRGELAPLERMLMADVAPATHDRARRQASRGSRLPEAA